MAENPHYESQHSTSSVSESKEDRDKASTMPFLVLNRKPDYPVISSSCLHPMKELGEGVFGKVHLAMFSSSEEADAEKFLVAVSILHLHFVWFNSCKLVNSWWNDLEVVIGLFLDDLKTIVTKPLVNNKY